MINKLGDGHNFSLITSAFLVEDFVQTNLFAWMFTNHEHVCLDMHYFCSFDNWLCDLISENWQVTLRMHMCTHMHICTHMHTHILYMNTHMHTHTHAHTHTYVNTQWLPNAFLTKPRLQSTIHEPNHDW